MFVYLSKKIAIPHKLALNVVSWNGAQGWIACGGERGLLKVLKLESSGEGGSSSAQGASNLSMNQTLEGHQGNVVVLTWNEPFRKLTTSDQNGLIIVWMLHRGVWFEEMINNRNRSVVRDMKWTNDGQKICIIYEDGAVIVGTVDGQRLWGKEVKTELSHVEWAPDAKTILFCTLQSEVHVYDNEGVYSHRISIHCLDEGYSRANIVGINWCKNVDSNAPSMAVAFDIGRIQVMRTDTDDRPVLIDVEMQCVGIKWNPSGTTLAVLGMQQPQGAQPDMNRMGVVQFYDPNGVHLRTLNVPGQALRSLSWEGDGLRLALAVDSHIYFSNIRPDYLWGYFSNTLVYAVLKKDRNEHAVCFWRTQNDEKSVKYIKNVTHIQCGEQYCVLVTKSDDDSGQYVLVVCNDIGSPVASKYIKLVPSFVAMTNSHVVACSEEHVYIWNFRATLSKLQQTGDPNASSPVAVAGRKSEFVWHIEDTGCTNLIDRELPTGHNVMDPIAAVTANKHCVVVARDSGRLFRYSLPHPVLELKLILKCRPNSMGINMNATRCSVIDIHGLLSLYDISDQSPVRMDATADAKLQFERKDVWNLKWASDNEELFAIMEKTRMYVVRGLQPEEPVLSNAWICQFKDLQITSFLIDDVMRNPDSIRKDVLLDFETKSLRDTRDILAMVPNLRDAFNYVEQNPHPRLWRLLAEAALDNLDFGVAEKAFVRYENFQGIKFVEHLKLQGEVPKQKALVCAYFQRFDEAEQIYRDMGRMRLAIELRKKLGDYFRVIQLAQESPEFSNDMDLMNDAWNGIGKYYADRGKWKHAAQYFSKAKNTAELVNAYYILEEYDKVSKLIEELPEGDPLLGVIGDHLSCVGLCEQAVQAFSKLGDYQSAIDTCVVLNSWDLAMEVGQTRSGNQQLVESLLIKYAAHLIEKNDRFQAVNLYRKASRNTEAAKLINEVAIEQMTPEQLQRFPLRYKKLYLLAALEVEKHKAKTMDLSGNTAITQQTLATMMTTDQGMAGDRAIAKPWRGCEAVHLYMLAQRQLYNRQFEDAMKTALRLADYESILDVESIYTIIALATYYNKFFQQCSKAFIKLEGHQSIPEDRREQLSALALSIFTRHKPRDPSSRMYPCPKCKHSMHDWEYTCTSCNHKLPFCVASGKSIFTGKGEEDNTMRCRTCSHRTFAGEARKSEHCMLCHTSWSAPNPYVKGDLHNIGKFAKGTPARPVPQAF